MGAALYDSTLDVIFYAVTYGFGSETYFFTLDANNGILIRNAYNHQGPNQAIHSMVRYADNPSDDR